MRNLVFVLGVAILTFFSLSASAQGPGDAIAVRVIPNSQRLSPLMWYQQNVPNPGSPRAMEVDGYPAIRDGRSVYVAGTNYDEASAQLYSNIYLISHSDAASPKVQAVFNEFIKQFHLNVNIADEEDKLQIRRDMHRANDLNFVRASVESYMSKTGSYPEFEAGSYLPSSSYSTWPSWQTTLGNMLGIAMPLDPRNEFLGCEDPYDTNTCWDQTGLQFACPPEAYVYGYRSDDDGSSYSIFTNYEYSGPGNWRDQNFSQQSSDQCFNFMGGDISDVDADGIPAGIDNCPEVFNSPDQTDNDEDGIGNACDLCNNDAENDKDNDGVCGDIDNCSSIANPDQSDLDGNGIGDVCDYQTCGNNIAEGSEKCDGQSGLKDYQQCSENCDLISQLSFCGDEIVDTPNAQGLVEECDSNNQEEICKTGANEDLLIDGYLTQRSRICRETCRYSPYTPCLPIESCGDSTINGLEECDTGENVGVQCESSYGQTCEYCDASCQFEIAEGPHCGDGIIQSDNGEECDQGVNNDRLCTPPYGKTCEYCGNTCKIESIPAPYCGDGTRNDPFESCDTTGVQTIPCEPEPTYIYKDRSCSLQSTALYPACTWEDYGDCTARGSCGDGEINGPELCDDGKTPGVCIGCEVADNVVTASYKIDGSSSISVCLGNKGSWGVMGEMTPEEAVMTCGGAVFEDGRWINRLTDPMSVDLLFWVYSTSCQNHVVEAKYKGEQVSILGTGLAMPFGFCVHGFRGIDLGGALVDEVSSDQQGGSVIRGKVSISEEMEISTTDGIVVLENLKDRSFNGRLLPSDTYTLSFGNSGYLVWLGDQPNAPYESGTMSTTTVNKYILGCVDMDSNNQCDYNQDLL